MSVVLKTLNLVAIVITMQGCGMKSATQRLVDDEPASNSSNISTQGQTPIHSQHGWADQVNIFLDKRAPKAVELALKNAIDTWNSAVDRNILRFQGRQEASKQESLFSVLDDAQTIVYFDANWARNTGKAETVLGTTVWESDANDSQAIARGDIILNAQNYYFADATQYPDRESDAAGLVDAETVILHEVGHLIGLDHVSSDLDESSVMHAQTPIGFDNYTRSLSDGDIERVQSIYLK